MKIKFILMTFLMLSISFVFGADTVPVNTTSTSVLDLVGIGKLIESFMLIPFKAIETKMSVIGGRKTASIAENIFTVLFMLETTYTLANQYLEGAIEKIPTTFVVRAFFGSCVLALIHNGLIFGIISDVMTALVKGIGNAPNFSWFADGNFNTVISSLTKNGPLSKLDDLFNGILNSLDVLHIDNIGQLALILCVCCLMTKIYIEGFKIVLGMFIKGIEWCFGLPVAMIMLGLKGSKITEDYFNTGIRYIYGTALDFTITLLCIDIGGVILDQAVKDNTNAEGFTESLITIISFLIAFAIWKTLLFGAETLIGGILGGSPAFTASQAAGIISNLASAAKSVSKGGLTPVRAGVAGIISKANGGTFMGGAMKSLGNDVKGYGIGLASSEGWKNTNEGMKKIEKFDAEGKRHEVWATGDASETSGLKHVMADSKKIADSKKAHINRVKDVMKFEEEHNISEQMMKKMGYHTVAQRDDFMNRHTKLTNMKQDLDDFKVQSKTINSKGKSVSRDMFEIEKDLAVQKQDFTSMNTQAQINKSENSNLTKQMLDSFNHMSNSDEKAAVLKTWLKSGQNDPLNFSMNKFNDSLNKTIEQIKNSNVSEEVKNNQLQSFRKIFSDEIDNPKSREIKFDTSFKDIKVKDVKSGDEIIYKISDVAMQKIADENQIIFNDFLTSSINKIN